MESQGEGNRLLCASTLIFSCFSCPARDCYSQTDLKLSRRKNQMLNKNGQMSSLAISFRGAVSGAIHKQSGLLPNPRVCRVKEDTALCLLREPFQFCAFCDAKKYRHLRFSAGVLIGMESAIS